MHFIFVRSDRSCQISLREKPEYMNFPLMNSMNQHKSKSSIVIRDTPYLTIDLLLEVVVKKIFPLSSLE